MPLYFLVALVRIRQDTVCSTNILRGERGGKAGVAALIFKEGSYSWEVLKYIARGRSTIPYPELLASSSLPCH